MAVWLASCAARNMAVRRNALQAINTGFSATDSTVEYLPDFEDTTPLLTTLLTRAPPKYAPPKFDVIRMKLK